MAYTKTNLNETTETVAVDMAAEDIENNETTETVAEQNARGYSKTVWNESTPITADKLNKMETGIANGIDKTMNTMEIPITNSDGWQQFRWTKPNYNAISWTRDAKARKALEVVNETKHTQLLLLNDDGVLTTSGTVKWLTWIDKSNSANFGDTGLKSVINSNANPEIHIGGQGIYTLYHTGNKTTAAEVGALPLTGGTLTGDTTFNQFLKLNAWPNYGTGTAQLWYDGNNKLLNIQNAEGLKAGSHRVATWEGNPTHYMFRYGSGLGGANGYITFSY